MARLSAFRNQIDAFKLGLQGTRAEIMAQAAKIGLEEAQRANRAAIGRDPAFEQFVDGVRGAAPETVKPGGVIIYLLAVGAATLNVAVEDGVRIFRAIAPVGSPPRDDHPGLYRRSLVVLVNDQLRPDIAEGGTSDLGDDDIVSLTDAQPYAGRLENGWSKQAENGVLQVVAAALRASYGNIVNISQLTYETYPSYSGRGLRPTIRMSVR